MRGQWLSETRKLNHHYQDGGLPSVLTMSPDDWDSLFNLLEGIVGFNFGSGYYYLPYQSFYPGTFYSSSVGQYRVGYLPPLQSIRKWDFTFQENNYSYQLQYYGERTTITNDGPDYVYDSDRDFNMYYYNKGEKNVVGTMQGRKLSDIVFPICKFIYDLYLIDIGTSNADFPISGSSDDERKIMNEFRKPIEVPGKVTNIIFNGNRNGQLGTISGFSSDPHPYGVYIGGKTSGSPAGHGDTDINVIGWNVSSSRGVNGPILSFGFSPLNSRGQQDSTEFGLVKGHYYKTMTILKKVVAGNFSMNEGGIE